VLPRCALPLDGGPALDVPFERARGQYPEEGAANMRGVRNPAGICAHHCSPWFSSWLTSQRPVSTNAGTVVTCAKMPKNHSTLMRSPG
jgi:hypothetical protein